MLQSAARYYQQQQALAALGVRAARRSASVEQLVGQVSAYQAASALLAEQGATAMLSEQGIDPAAVGAVNPSAFVTDRPSFVGMVQAAATDEAVDRMVATLVQDAGRSGMGATIAARPAVTGHIRYVNAPSCARCAILAGRFYRWSEGFQRHPRCDCQMVPSTQAAAPGLISDPLEAFNSGAVRGLSKADAAAIRDGADMSQVVNIHRKAAGLSAGSSVLARGGRLTPEGIYRIAKTRAEALQLLSSNGYITTPTLARVAAPPAATIRKASTPSEDLAAANPRYADDEGYRVNCGNSVTAYELRRRGLDVSAKPVSVEAIRRGGIDVDGFLSTWRTPAGAAPELIRTGGISGTRDLLKTWPDDARGFVMVGWKGGGGHVFVVEKVDGVTRYIDPQLNKVYDESVFKRVRPRMTFAVRSDNLTPTDAARAATQ